MFKLAIIAICLQGLFMPSMAYGFNSVILMDPAFLTFIFIYVPILAGILMAVFEFLMTMPLFKTSYKKRLLVRLVASNISSLYLYIFITLFVMFLTQSELQDEEFKMVRMMGVVYFGLMYIFFAAQGKIKLFQKFKIPKTKLMITKVFFINIISYSMLYTYLFYRIY